MKNIQDHHFTIQGAATAIDVYADSVEETALQQLHHIASCPAFNDSKIVIMPDVHAGKGAVIGFTATISDKVSPNVVGVDIGCGVLGCNIGTQRPDFAKLDRFIRDKIPSGHNVHTKCGYGNTIFEDDMAICTREVARDMNKFDSVDYYDKSIGTLGGGNHFIEVGYSSKTGDYWVIIHSGSRKFGNDIGNYYWKLAKEQGNYSQGNKSLAWLVGKDREEYLHAAKIAQRYAQINRRAMAETLLHYLGYDARYVERYESVHNYIDFTTKNSLIVRKGAISAMRGERVIIPLNMAEGCIIGVGKGNADWNLSAPHGAGRTMSRSGAKKTLRIEDFEESMKDVWSSCVCAKTLDEAPQAYKPSKGILDALPQTVEITDILKSVYNFKSV